MIRKVKKYAEILRDYIEYTQGRNLYMGDIGIIFDSEVEKSSNKVNVLLKIRPIKENCRLIKTRNYFRDMDTYIKYYDTNIVIGSCRVINSTPIGKSKTKSINRKR